MQEDFEVETEEIEEAETDRGGLSKGKRALIFVLIALVLAAIVVVLWLFSTYDDYEEMSSIDLANEDETVTEPVFTEELLRQTILDPETGYRSHPKVVSGPYMLTSWDGSTAEFEVNPYYLYGYFFLRSCRNCFPSPQSPQADPGLAGLPGGNLP